MPPLHHSKGLPTRLGLALLLLLPPPLWAGADAFRTLVVVNTNSADSIALGSYYATAHGIPGHHICPVNIPTNQSNFTTFNDFRTLLQSPVTNHIAANNLAGRIDFLVLCYNLPTRVRDAEGVSSTFFYGFKNIPTYWEAPADTCKLPLDASNAYYLAERAFHSEDAWNATNGFIAFHLVAADLDTAKRVADRGAAAQASLPPASINLHILGDQYRGVREQLFANTLFAFDALPGLAATCAVPPYYSVMSGRTNVMGYQDGFSNLLDPALDNLRTNNAWLPGAYADHMTSYGGRINNLSNGDPYQTTVLDWMDIDGITASYGTVTEPCAYLEKFPDPFMGFLYARGFTIGEAYAMAVEAPVHGLFAGDPLAAPFAAPPSLTVTSPAPGQIVTGTIPLHVSASAHPGGAPAAALDLYLNGRFHTHLATLGPTPGNQASVTVGNLTNTYTVATNDTLFDVVSGLANAVNDHPSSVVTAHARGDRLELIYNTLDHDGDHLPVSAGTAQGTASALTLGTGLAATSLVPSVAFARKTVYLQAYSGGANTGDFLRCVITLTNGVAVTNHLAAAQGESVRSILERLRSAVTSHPALSGTDGVRYDRLASSAPAVIWAGAFFARTPGPDSWPIQLDYTVHAVSNTSGLITNSSFTSFLDDRTSDVVPRASVLFHITPTNGILTAEAPLDTTSLPDGEHVLDIVARDGSAVAAASRLTLPIAVANTSLVLGVSSAHGTGSPPAGLLFLMPGSLLTNSVSVPAPANGTQLVCTGWTMSGNEPAAGSSTNFSMTLTNHAALAWLWATNYWLDTEAAPHGSIPTPDSWQPANVFTQITAVPDAYYAFANWSGDASGTNNPLNLLMDSPKAVQAHFAALLATNSTPHWWLALHGWTNDFDAAALDDPDTDGSFTWQEFVADTDPTNSASFFPPLAASLSATNLGFSISPTSTGRHYFIDTTMDIVAPGWINLTNAPGPSGAWQPICPLPATGTPQYYRGRVSLPP